MTPFFQLCPRGGACRSAGKFAFWAFVYRSGGFARADAGGFLRAAGLVLV